MKRYYSCRCSGTFVSIDTCCIKTTDAEIKPMIYYPSQLLKKFSSQRHRTFVLKSFLVMVLESGISLSYAVQPSPDGLAQAFIIGEDFIGDDSVALVLGDNIFHGNGLSAILQLLEAKEKGATVFNLSSQDPERFGVS